MAKEYECTQYVVKAMMTDFFLEKLLGLEGLVGRGAVEAGDGDVVETEVDAELGDVVDHVVEEEAAEHGGARGFGDDLRAEAEAPGFLEGLVAGVDEGVAAFLRGVIECGEGRAAAPPFERGLRARGCGHVHA